MVRRKEVQKLTGEERQEKRKAILTALAKASEGNEFIENKAPLTADELQDYYILSHSEMEALVNGDMAKIEAWASNLDKNHAARLLQWLIKEKW